MNMEEWNFNRKSCSTFVHSLQSTTSGHFKFCEFLHERRTLNFKEYEIFFILTGRFMQCWGYF